ncbi:DUF1127 domain-containing protein [Siculibacillus lacustris]|uniref:DUF1127 domain-containing protein n=1 Tax=Siculibacillus lacustris TaxID=1549641 RepID=A0A4Q9VN22_9HYPH|nr:DUF1127 domain-containing protein [Siculibacillus lacustris]TBW36933.1 DUF1127 domain-containing protein [Siculibacillus lacustris]
MSVARVAESIARSWTRFRLIRETVAELQLLDDRELADLGIDRYDIPRVAREAVN